jgi:hypothetical protein
MSLFGQRARSSVELGRRKKLPPRSALTCTPGRLPTLVPAPGAGITVDDLRNRCAQMETVSHLP